MTDITSADDLVTVEPDAVDAGRIPLPAEPEIVSIKGFDSQFRCRGVQFEVGGTYTHDGAVVACESGFHAIDGHPLEVLGYYPPAGSRYAEVRQSGQLARHSADSKVASARISIVAEISLGDLIGRAVRWVMDRAKPEGEQATGDWGAASATGDWGAASATGDWGAASATGDWGAAMASGPGGRAMGAEGCALFLVHRDEDGDITRAWAGIVGRDGIKPGVWYSLGADGQPVEV